MATLGEGHRKVERGGGLGDAALLVGEGDDAGAGVGANGGGGSHAMPIRTPRADSCPLPFPPPVSGLLDKRLVFVTGKGGVGRTTVALSLGLAAARAGRRTIV